VQEVEEVNDTSGTGVFGIRFFVCQSRQIWLRE
jgi:hypothetical protein